MVVTRRDKVPIRGRSRGWNEGEAERDSVAPDPIVAARDREAAQLAVERVKGGQMESVEGTDRLVGERFAGAPQDLVGDRDHVAGALKGRELSPSLSGGNGIQATFAVRTRDRPVRLNERERTRQEPRARELRAQRLVTLEQDPQERARLDIEQGRHSPRSASRSSCAVPRWS